MTATSPEELELLLEDALLMVDDAAVGALFDASGVILSAAGSVPAAANVRALRPACPYVAAVRSATVVRDVAVVLGERTANVSLRGPDRRWRLLAVIVLDASAAPVGDVPH